LDERLDSWKEIARYLGREVRTVQRWTASRGLPVHRLPGGGRPRVFSLKPEIDAWLQAGTEQAQEDASSVAVLPFLNLTSSAQNQYFGDGLAEEIIDALVRVPGLRVTARTSSFAVTARGEDVCHIGARLGATWLLEGSVRRAGKRVRVSAQLINTHNGYHAWSQTYERQLLDIFGIQDEIARSIAAALKPRLVPSLPASGQTQNLAAYDLWMRGRSISQRYTPETFAQARECYEAAISRDPGFARPYFGLAELLFYGVQFGIAPEPDALPRVREAIMKSLQFDELCGEAHSLLGICRGLLDYDWSGAESAFRRALELSPGSATILIQHAWYHLVPRMRIEEALFEGGQAVALDPLSPFVRGLFGLVLIVARQYARAVEECRSAVQLAPGLWWLHWFYATALLLQGKRVQALRHSRKVYDQIHQPLVVGGMALFYGFFMQSRKAKQMLAELEETSKTSYVPPFAFAMAYLGLKDDRVFEWLDKAMDARDPIVTHLPSMPLYDGIRSDSRFRALLEKMHLQPGACPV
jgi:serine/threonine-protein kinase